MQVRGLLQKNASQPPKKLGSNTSETGDPTIEDYAFKVGFQTPKHI